jgi:hypothetical protein
VRAWSLALALVFCGCSKPWFTTSAAIMPNPVLIGPIERVHAKGPPPPPPAVHRLSDEDGIRVDVWHQDVSTSSSMYSTTTYTTTRTDAAINLGFEIFARLAPTTPIQERYQKSDIVLIHSIRLETSTLSNRGFGHSDTHESFWLMLKSPMLEHFAAPGAQATQTTPTDPAPSPSPTPSPNDPGEKRQ